jgi:superfamily II DNA or RNA helicase
MIRVIERVPNKLPGLSSLFISFDFNRRIVDELKLLNNSHFNPETKEWEVPVTSLSELLDRLCIIDDISMQFMETVKEKTPAEVDINKYKTKPFDYQLEGIKYGLSHDSWLLLDAPGLGKTLQLTYLAQELREKRGVQHCLIVCGINTLKTNWKSEIEKHSDLPCMILGQRINKRGRLVIDGIPNRLKQLQSPINEFFVITNVETLREEKIVKALLKNKPNKFDMIIFDEIHTCKSPSNSFGIDNPFCLRKVFKPSFFLFSFLSLTCL